VELNVM